jgi:flagellar basal body-associated protein FliL
MDEGAIKNHTSKKSNLIVWILMMVVIGFFSMVIVMMNDKGTFSSLSSFLQGLLLSAPIWVTIALLVSTFSKNQKTSRIFSYTPILYPVFLIILFVSISLPSGTDVSSWGEYQILNYSVKYPRYPVYRSDIAIMKYSSATSSVPVEISLSYDKNNKTSYSVIEYYVVNQGLLDKRAFLQETLLQVAEANNISIAISSFVTFKNNPSLDFTSDVKEQRLVRGKIITTNKGLFVLMAICEMNCDSERYQAFID